MKQVVQSTRGGPVQLVETPHPLPAPTEVLVRTEATVISAGTERSVTRLAQSNLAAKARARPDLVRQVIGKARTDGVRATVDTVRSRLDDDVLLGYAGAGRIEAIGSLVRGLRVGQLVATAGGGCASHAHAQAVPQTLVAPVPDGVAADHAAFATIAAIALHGLRTAEVGVGDNVIVVGLGLIGQLTCRLAAAAGCNVAGVDIDPRVVATAQEHGALGLVEQGEATTRHALDWTRGRGADAVLITAGATGDSGIIQAVPPRCRDRATIVAVGDIGLDLDRNEFYHRELELKVARSYGPGRYDPSYEEWAVDYPVGYVRWTEGRNLEAVLDLMASGRLDVSDLVSRRFPIDDATKAYELLSAPEPGAEAVFGIVFTYPEQGPNETVDLRSSGAGPVPAARPRFGDPRSDDGTRPVEAVTRTPWIGVCGAGQFVRGVILPSIRTARLGRLAHIASSSGVTAARVAERAAIPRVSAGTDEILGDDDLDVIVIATPHDSHGPVVVDALDRGRHVYVEKPLAITDDELTAVEAALARNRGQLHVGFNRRWSPMVAAAIDSLEGSGPVAVDYRVNAGPIPTGHWYRDRRQGGRLLGEVCHFIDTACALVGTDPVAVTCAGVNHDAHDSYAVLIAFADGSAATINYVADAHPGTAKERCEVTGRGHTVVIDNYRALTVDGRAVKVATGKGHVESLVAFGAALRSGRRHDSEPALASTRLALRALQSLTEGATIHL